MAQDRTSKLGEEALDDIEPGAVLRGEDEFETAYALLGEPGFCLPGDVRGMIISNQLDGRIGRIDGIEKLEKVNELAAAMAVLDQGVNLAREQIDTGQQTDCAVALVLVIAREGRMFAGSGGRSAAVVASA